MPLRILLVEDEQELAGAVQTVLQRQGHVVDHCADGLQGWMLLCSALARYELAIVDWMLPGLSGPELCRRARTAGLQLPLLLLTARAETADRVEGLDAGADDYLSKPFAMEELLARVRALQRGSPAIASPCWRWVPIGSIPKAGCWRSAHRLASWRSRWRGRSSS
jgi:two-component system Ni(II)/redox-responsive regulator NrsR